MFIDPTVDGIICWRNWKWNYDGGDNIVLSGYLWVLGFYRRPNGFDLRPLGAVKGLPPQRARYGIRDRRHVIPCEAVVVAQRFQSLPEAVVFGAWHTGASERHLRACSGFGVVCVTP